MGPPSRTTRRVPPALQLSAGLASGTVWSEVFSQLTSAGAQSGDALRSVSENHPQPWAAATRIGAFSAKRTDVIAITERSNGALAQHVS
jgi:hypothetical protein